MAQPEVLILNTKRTSSDGVPELHSMPCKIEHTGPANVSSYFQREKQGKGSEKATFRGRFLDGNLQTLPENYSLFVTKERNTSATKRILDVDASKDSFMLWEYDKVHAASNPIPRAIQFLRIAEDFAADD